MSAKNQTKRKRTEHGWFQPGAHSYENLLEKPSVQLLIPTFTPTSKSGHLYQLKHFLEINNLTPESLLDLKDKEIQQAVMKAIAYKQSKGNYSAARKMFYVVRRFLELNGREIYFNKTQRKVLLKREPKKISKEHIPTREEIYRMADSFPDKGPLQKKRGKAIVLCLWQSGVRANCLCSWTYGIFKNQIYPEPQSIVQIKVVAHRDQETYDCAVDTKLSSYAVNYYFTFLSKEAIEALKEYLDERKNQGWIPKDNDSIFVTHGVIKAKNGKPLTPSHIISIVKNAANQIGIPKESTWTHLLRKAFRKTLYASGVDPDIAEALMGHKLAASKTSYFDYHDSSFVRKEYSKGNWMRISIAKIETMEEEISELRKTQQDNENLRQRIDKLEEFLSNFSKAMKNPSNQEFDERFKEAQEERKQSKQDIEEFHKTHPPMNLDPNGKITEKEVKKFLREFEEFQKRKKTA